MQYKDFRNFMFASLYGVAKDRVNTGRDTLTVEVFSVPDSDTAIRACLAHQITARINNIDIRVIHQARDGNNTFVVRTNRIRIGINIIIVLIRLGSITTERSKAVSRTDKHIARYRIDG